MQNNKIQEFTDLKVWQSAHNLTLEIYQITKQFHRDELFRLVNQLCRAVSSIPANIAEGFGRNTTKEFIQFLYIARGSTKETLYHLILAKDLKYINDKQFDKRKEQQQSLANKKNCN